MDRNQIRQLIQQEDLKNSNKVLDKQLIRLFEKLCTLDAQLEGWKLSPEDLPILEEENRKLEERILNGNTQLVEVDKETEELRATRQSFLAKHSAKKRELENAIKAEQEKCQSLRATITQLNNRTIEMERLKRTRNGLREESLRLQDKIDNLGEEHQKNSDLLHSLKPFVEQLEELEKQMENIMGKIWADCKNDAFDRMF